MSAYLVMQITITDPQRWGAYRDAVMPLISKFGGRHASKPEGVEMLEGRTDDRRVVMFEFPSMDAIREFWHSPEYAPIKELRQGAGTLEAWAVPGS